LQKQQGSPKAELPFSEHRSQAMHSYSCFQLTQSTAASQAEHQKSEICGCTTPGWTDQWLPSEQVLSDGPG